VGAHVLASQIIVRWDSGAAMTTAKALPAPHLAFRHMG